MTESPRPRRRARTTESTESAFLDAAERLFAEYGYDGTSVRAIAEQAGANLGALHYYWGSKEALFRTLCERRLRPVVEQRLLRFDECVVQAAGGTPDLEDVLRAFFEPGLLHEDIGAEELTLVGKLLARIGTSPSPEVQRIRAGIVDEASFRFVRLLRQCCEHLDDESFYWRLQTVFGTGQYALSGIDRIRLLSHGRWTGQNMRRGIDEFIYCLATLLAAPVLPATTTPNRSRRGART